MNDIRLPGVSFYPDGEVRALLSDEQVVAVLKRCSDLIYDECGVTERIPKSERHLSSAFAVEGGDIQEEIAALLETRELQRGGPVSEPTFDRLVGRRDPDS